MKINNLASLRRETEQLEYKLKLDKSKLKTEFRLLRFQIIEYALKEVIGLFKKSPTRKDEPDSDQNKSGEE